jgi:hypothetical protein
MVQKIEVDVTKKKKLFYILQNVASNYIVLVQLFYMSCLCTLVLEEECKPQRKKLYIFNIKYKFTSLFFYKIKYN